VFPGIQLRDPEAEQAEWALYFSDPVLLDRHAHDDLAELQAAAEVTTVSVNTVLELFHAAVGRVINRYA
jgi:hypothetical protein